MAPAYVARAFRPPAEDQRHLEGRLLPPLSSQANASPVPPGIPGTGAVEQVEVGVERGPGALNVGLAAHAGRP